MSPVFSQALLFVSAIFLLAVTLIKSFAQRLISVMDGF
jgi:hypothetical protein